MFRVATILVLFVLTLGLQSRADAFNHVVCTNCTSEGDFIQAAQEWVGQAPGDFHVTVGGLESGKIYSVGVFNYPPGTTPFGSEDQPSPRQALIDSSKTTVIGQVSVENLVVTIDHRKRGEHHFSTQSVMYSYRASAADEDAFGAIVYFSRNSIMVNIGDDGALWGSSFSGRDNIGLAKVINASMTATNPAWQPGQMPSLGAAFKNAILAALGKGPSACVVFINGDSACFQLNALDPNAIRYIDGTAKDINGNPISESGGIGGGGGLDLDQRSPAPTQVVGFGRTTGYYWLFCSWINGVRDVCWIEFIPE